MNTNSCKASTLAAYLAIEHALRTHYVNHLQLIYLKHHDTSPQIRTELRAALTKVISCYDTHEVVIQCGDENNPPESLAADHGLRCDVTFRIDAVDNEYRVELRPSTLPKTGCSVTDFPDLNQQFIYDHDMMSDAGGNESFTVRPGTVLVYRVYYEYGDFNFRLVDDGLEGPLYKCNVAWAFVLDTEQNRERYLECAAASEERRAAQFRFEQSWNSVKRGPIRFGLMKATPERVELNAQVAHTYVRPAPQLRSRLSPAVEMAPAVEDRRKHR